MEYTTLLLDMDGTFLDFGAAERSAFFRAMDNNGYEADEGTYKLYSRINHGLWEAFERGRNRQADPAFHTVWQTV